MIAWMLYSVMLGTLVLAAAFGIEQVLRLNGKPMRWVWLTAIMISLVVPAVLPFLPERVSEPAVLPIIPASFAIQLDAVSPSIDVPTWTVPRLLGLGWLALSSALVLLGLIAALRLRSARRQWRRGEISGASVLISDATGPAVIGFIKPDIVVPDWVSELPESNQRMILAHERSHILAHDPLLMILSRVAPALLPWNPAVWLQARRLRECVELDCDARLLAESAHPSRYAALLLDVGRRTASSPMFVAALTEPRSLLERRIRRMLEPKPRRPGLRGASWSVLAAIAVLCAFSAPLPGEPVTIPRLVDPPRLVVHPETELPALPQDTSKPRLLNGAEVQENARRYYPPLVRDAGISGTPMIWVHVDETGVVRSTRVSAPSTHKALDEAALKVAGTMRFAPAQFRGRSVSKWIEVGVEFKSDRAAPPETNRAQTPEPVLYSVKPGMKNVADVAQAMQRFYPPLLRDAGIGGTAVIWLFVEETGEVTKAQVRRGTGHQALDEAAMKVAELAVFTPALIRERKTTSWVELPVTFANGAVQLGSFDVTIITGLDEEKRRIEQLREEARARAENRTTSDIDAAPTFTPYTVKPEMVNTAEVVRMMQRVYPPLLRDAGIGGKVLIWFLIDEQGDVIKTQVKKGSGHVALDEAALQVAEMVKFTAALNRDQKVKVWIEIPIEFKTQ